jgi:hypothetical protein
MITLAYKAPPELETKIRAALRKESKSQSQWVTRFGGPSLRSSWPIGVSLRRLDVGIAQQRSSIDRSGDFQSCPFALRRSSARCRLFGSRCLKPWFVGKLEFAPPVLNLLTKGGYKLAGARIDILANRRVAAIVYKDHDCFITVFIWPAADHAIDLDTQSLLSRNRRHNRLNATELCELRFYAPAC